MLVELISNSKIIYWSDLAFPLWNVPPWYIPTYFLVSKFGPGHKVVSATNATLAQGIRVYRAQYAIMVQ